MRPNAVRSQVARANSSGSRSLRRSAISMTSGVRVARDGRQPRALSGEQGDPLMPALYFSLRTFFLGMGLTGPPLVSAQPPTSL